MQLTCPCRHVVFPGTPEHGTPEHPETSRNITEHPQKLGTPPRKPGTPPRKPGTPQMCKILRIPPRIEVRSRPLMKRQKPRKVIVILQSHKLENFTIFTISKIVTGPSHSHMLIFLWAYLYERANEENGGGEGIRLPLSSSPLDSFTPSLVLPSLDAYWLRNGSQSIFSCRNQHQI